MSACSVYATLWCIRREYAPATLVSESRKEHRDKREGIGRAPGKGINGPSVLGLRQINCRGWKLYLRFWRDHHVRLLPRNGKCSDPGLDGKFRPHSSSYNWWRGIRTPVTWNVGQKFDFCVENRKTRERSKSLIWWYIREDCVSDSQGRPCTRYQVT